MGVAPFRAMAMRLAVFSLAAAWFTLGCDKGEGPPSPSPGAPAPAPAASPGPAAALPASPGEPSLAPTEAVAPTAPGSASSDVAEEARRQAEARREQARLEQLEKEEADARRPKAAPGAAPGHPAAPVVLGEHPRTEPGGLVDLNGGGTGTGGGAHSPSPSPSPRPNRPPSIPATAATPASAAPPSPDDEIADEQRDLDDAIAHLKTGRYAFSVPETMGIDDQASVVVNVSGSDNAALHNGLGDAGVHFAPVKISPVMVATLQGDDFTIEGSSSEQIVDDADGGHWEWLITPKSQGTHTLLLTLNVVIHGEGGDKQKQFASEKRVIPVVVSRTWQLKHFASDHWQAALGAVMAPPPLALALWALLRKRRQEDRPFDDD